MENLENYKTLTQTVAHSRMSNKYSFIPTGSMLEILADHGWHPSKVREASARVEENKGFQKHIVRLRRENYPVVSVGQYVPEIILENSHMGTAAFKLKAGCYRLVCSNGLTAGEDWSSESIRHIGFSSDKAEEAIRRISNQVPKLIECVEGFRAQLLNDAERKAYAEAAIELIKDDSGKYAIAPEQLLRTRRWADRSDLSVWGAFNTVQENIIKGGILQVDTEGRTRRTRAIKSIDRDQKLNAALWSLTEKLAAIKAAQ